MMEDGCVEAQNMCDNSNGDDDMACGAAYGCACMDAAMNCGDEDSEEVCDMAMMEGCKAAGVFGMVVQMDDEMNAMHELEKMSEDATGEEMAQMMEDCAQATADCGEAGEDDDCMMMMACDC